MMFALVEQYFLSYLLIRKSYIQMLLLGKYAVAFILNGCFEPARPPCSAWQEGGLDRVREDI